MLGRGGGVAMIPAPETCLFNTENASRLVRYVMMIGKKKRLYYGAVVSNRQRGDCRPLPTKRVGWISKQILKFEVARMINLPQAAVLPKRAIQCTISPSVIFIFASSLSSLTVRPTIGDTTDADLLKSTRELG
ncbi:hypothetical protein Tco_0907601 [Tanacetum coccineum]|uniref:Uncharacterized protein n=1 Tax=Tanacetum coccineum TaxID=301880 RepID=A0ABQ5CJQ5_9ASTR